MRLHRLVLRLSNQLRHNPASLGLGIVDQYENAVFISMLSAAEKNIIDTKDIIEYLSEYPSCKDAELFMPYNELLSNMLAMELAHLNDLVVCEGDNTCHFQMKAILESYKMYVPGSVGPKEFMKYQACDPCLVRQSRIMLYQYLADMGLPIPWNDARESQINHLEDEADRIAGCSLGELLNPGHRGMLVNICDYVARRRGRCSIYWLLKYSQVKNGLDMSQISKYLLYDPYGCGPMKVVKKDCSIMLYSVGSDGVDNEGDANKDMVIWSAPERMFIGSGE